MKIISTNRKASFNYELFDRYEAGIVLTGGEVKSIRNNQVTLNEAYVHIRQGEIFILNMHISPYEYVSAFVPEVDRTRKLLLHKKEINKIAQKVKLEKLVIVPTKIYFSINRIKIEIATAKGKKLYDKRESIKQKDIERQLKKYR